MNRPAAASSKSTSKRRGQTADKPKPPTKAQLDSTKKAHATLVSADKGLLKQNQDARNNLDTPHIESEKRYFDQQIHKIHFDKTNPDTDPCFENCKTSQLSKLQGRLAAFTESRNRLTQPIDNVTLEESRNAIAEFEFSHELFLQGTKLYTTAAERSRAEERLSKKKK